MNHLQLKIPPPVYLLVFAGVMWLAVRYWPGFTLFDPPWNLAGGLLVLVALSMDFWSLGLFFRAHTTFNPIHPERTSHLVTDGPYRRTRNPMYVGMLMILAGWGIYLAVLTPFLLLPVFVWVLTVQQVIPEEQALEARFGDAYRAYQQQVPRWLW